MFVANEPHCAGSNGSSTVARDGAGSARAALRPSGGCRPEAIDVYLCEQDAQRALARTVFGMSQTGADFSR
jgi:hypothetical protein